MLRRSRLDDRRQTAVGLKRSEETKVNKVVNGGHRGQVRPALLTGLRRGQMGEANL